MKTPRAGTTWRYDPVLLDRTDPPAGRPKPGELLKVVRLPGAPPPGTMGMCHTLFVDTGEFAGLVCVNSLRRAKA